MKKAQRDVLRGVDRILVLTDKERRDIIWDFGDVSEKNFLLLRNGFESRPLVAGDRGDA
jgi:hypothetical protein